MYTIRDVEKMVQELSDLQRDLLLQFAAYGRDKSVPEDLIRSFNRVTFLIDDIGIQIEESKKKWGEYFE